MTFDFSGRSLEDATRVNRMREAYAAYAGVFPNPLATRPRKTNDAVIVNRCKPIVDKAVAALSGRGIDFQVADESVDGAQDYIDAMWRANKKMALLQKLFMCGAVCGHVFLKIVPAQPYPRLIVLDPATVSVEHMPDDVDCINSYVISYEATNGEGQNTEYRQTITRDGMGWVIVDQVKVGKMWQTTATTPWEYPFSPIIDAQNLPNPNSFYGTADITPDLIQLNKQLNRVYTDINRILAYNAAPKNWVSGLQGNKLSVSPDQTIVLPEGATMGMLEMHSSLNDSLAYASRIETAIDILSRTPSLALGDLIDVPRGQVTGPALETMLMPLIEKCVAKQALLGDLLSEVCRRILSMAGYGDDLEVFVRWPDIVPSDPQTTATVAAQLLAIGVSKHTVFARLNLDWEQEQEKLQLEQEQLQTPTDVPLQNTTQESETEPDEVNNTVQLSA